MDIIFEEKVNVLEKIKKVLKGGKILAIYRECDRIFAENTLKEIVREYRISRKIYPSNVECNTAIVSDVMDADDDIRLIFAFGGEAMIEIGKDASTLLGLPLVVMLTTPTRVSDGKSYVFRDDTLELHDAVKPKMVMANTGFLACRNDFSSLIGDIAERMIISFDKIFKDILSGNGIANKSTLYELIDTIGKLDEDDKLGILDSAYSLDMKDRSMASFISYLMAHASQDNGSNYKFALTYTILLLYKGYLSYAGDDISFPPDIEESAKLISKLYNYEVSDLVLEYKVMSSTEYMRILHMIAEYRSELIDMTNRTIMCITRLAKVFRRVSKDAGYNMYDDLSLDDLLSSISALSILETENTPLRVMKVGGFLEKYLK